jgi:murein L,D-transpeptidase YafK
MSKPIIVTLFILVIVSIAIGGTAFWANTNHPPLSTGTVADMVLIEKKERRLTLFKNGKPLKSYMVALGSCPVGKKLEEGDKRTPEGTYIIDRRKENSSYHHALHISYPNQNDTAQATARGVPPGGDIMIHGLPNGTGFLGKMHLKRDWTRGCIAVTNPEIEEIWQVVPDGTVVEIQP